jgi:hypothetical protein
MGTTEDPQVYRTTVLTAATGYYHVFVLPYVASYHFFNPDSRFEFFVDDPEEFESQYCEGLKILRNRLGEENLIISSPNTDHLHPNHHQAVPRFFQTPTVETEFIYIGDVDVLILDSMITGQHEMNMERNNLPFSNVLRDEDPAHEVRPRLTGLHFSKYEAYFPLPLEEINPEDQIELDEFALYELVKAKIGDFQIEHRFRPPHGFHFSDKLDYWNRGSSRQVGLHLSYLPNYQLLRETEYWKEIRGCFSQIFLTWLDCLDRTIEVLWPDLSGLPIVKPWFIDGRWIGPGINREVDVIQGVRLVRHQFLQVKSQQDSHLGEGSEAGQIFNFIDWCDKNKIRSIMSISELTPLFLTTILGCFEEIKMLVISPGRFDSDVFHFDNGTTNSELVQLTESEQISNELSKGGIDLAILQPTSDEDFGFIECLDRIRKGGNGKVRFIGMINANMPTEEGISTDIGTLHNFNLRHDAMPIGVFCLNNKMMKMVTGFGKDKITKEVRVYLYVYNIDELDELQPDNTEIPTLEDFIGLFKAEKYNKFIQVYEAFPNRFDKMLGLKHMTIRSYYLTERYAKCVGLCDTCLNWDPLALLFKARAQRNCGLVEEAIDTYTKQLETQPYNTNSLIECVMLMLSLDLQQEVREMISNHIEQTRDRAAVEDLVSKYGLD